MKYLALLLIISCSPSYKNLPDYAMPPELKDCKVFTISDGGMASPNLYVVKCPHEQPTTSFMRSCGKNCMRREYVQVTE